MDVFSEIIPEMSKETDQKKYEDWLFVFGSAIGYLQRDEATTRVTDVRKDVGRTVITVDGLPEGDWKGRRPRNMRRASPALSIQAIINSRSH
ncbi:MAG: hypothetical protein IPK83_10360 [Planctomycetes bacterium]|nr:hypothetical protein [Planctomycetota bacterium]